VVGKSRKSRRIDGMNVSIKTKIKQIITIKKKKKERKKERERKMNRITCCPNRLPFEIQTEISTGKSLFVFF